MPTKKDPWRDTARISNELLRTMALEQVNCGDATWGSIALRADMVRTSGRGDATTLKRALGLMVRSEGRRTISATCSRGVALRVAEALGVDPVLAGVVRQSDSCHRHEPREAFTDSYGRIWYCDACGEETWEDEPQHVLDPTRLPVAA